MSERSRAEAIRFEELTGAREEPYLFWFGGFTSIVLVVVAFVVVASSQGRLPFGVRPPAVAAEQVTESSPALARTSCAEIGSSDLRSPPEGLWFESNCISPPAPALITNVTNCNRTSLDPAEFTPVAPGLYVTRQTQVSTAYLWYSSSETCFDLVSARVVTAVCSDQAVSFEWNKRSACSGHGGVLAWVNGR